MTGKQHLTGALWILGFLLITGTPPSIIFLGKFIIVKEIIFQGRYLIAVAFLAALAVVFVGMARIFISMTQGVSTEESSTNNSSTENVLLRSCVPALLFVLVIGLGLYFPDWLACALRQAASCLGGQ